MDKEEIWTKLEIKAPHPMANAFAAPAYQSVAIYMMRDGNAVLSADRVHSNYTLLLVVNYLGNRVREKVTVNRGIITAVETQQQAPGTFNPEMSAREIRKKLFEFPEQHPLHPTYHNILRHKGDLELLKDREKGWSEDIEAIINGSGRFEPLKNK